MTKSTGRGDHEVQQMLARFAAAGVEVSLRRSGPTLVAVATHADRWRVVTGGRDPEEVLRELARRAGVSLESQEAR